MTDFFLTDLVEPRPSIEPELILDPSRRQRKRENSSGNRLFDFFSFAAVGLHYRAVILNWRFCVNDY